MIHNSLSKYEFIFDRTLGTWKTKPVDIELHSGVKTYHEKQNPVPHAHEYILKK